LNAFFGTRASPSPFGSGIKLFFVRAEEKAARKVDWNSICSARNEYTWGYALACPNKHVKLINKYIFVFRPDSPPPPPDALAN